MSEALTGFGSGPYNTLNYDRSWVTARVTLGVSIADDYSADAFLSDTLSLGTVVEAIKLADGFIYASLGLGFAVEIPAASIGGNYGVDLTIGGLVLEVDKLGKHTFNTSLTFDVSLADQETAQHQVHDTVTLGVSAAETFLADSVINAQLSLGTGFVYNNTASFELNSTVTLATLITAEVSSTGRFIDQWTSVPDSFKTREIWTTVSLGFD